MDINTYKHTNDEIKRLLKIDGKNYELYAVKRIEELENHLKEIAKFESMVIESDEVWNSLDGKPKLTLELISEWSKLQSKRKHLLGSHI